MKKHPHSQSVMRRTVCVYIALLFKEKASG